MKFQNIRIQRAIRKWTQKKLQKVSGVSAQNISKIENGEVDPKLCTVVKVAKAFNITVTELFELDYKN